MTTSQPRRARTYPKVSSGTTSHPIPSEEWLGGGLGGSGMRVQLLPLVLVCLFTSLLSYLCLSVLMLICFLDYSLVSYLLFTSLFSYFYLSIFVAYLFSWLFTCFFFFFTSFSYLYLSVFVAHLLFYLFFCLFTSSFLYLCLFCCSFVFLKVLDTWLFFVNS